MSTPTIAQLKQAITIAEQIEKLQTELAGLVGGSSSTASILKSASVSPLKKKGKRTMSPETIAKMRAAQQARWAKKKGTSGTAAAAAAPKAKATGTRKKRKTMSLEARAKIAAAAKARWAKKKAGN